MQIESAKARVGFAQRGPTWAQLGPKLRYLGPNWSPSWRWAQSDPDEPQIEAMWCTWRSYATLRNLGSFGDSFTPSWAQWRHNMGKIASNACTPVWSHVNLNLGRSCSQTGSSWSQVAPSWSQVGPKLEPSGSKLGWSSALGALSQASIPRC